MSIYFEIQWKKLAYKEKNWKNYLEKNKSNQNFLSSLKYDYYNKKKKKIEKETKVNINLNWKWKTKVKRFIAYFFPISLLNLFANMHFIKFIFKNINFETFFKNKNFSDTSEEKNGKNQTYHSLNHFFFNLYFPKLLKQQYK